MVCKHILLINFSNELKLILLQLNGSKYFYLSLTILLNISHLFTYSQMIKQFYFKQFSLALINCLHTV